jgi:hypothetical protein
MSGDCATAWEENVLNAAEGKWGQSAPHAQDGRPDPSLLTSIHCPPCTPPHGLSQ